jgi:hypothetical protein
LLRFRLHPSRSEWFCENLLQSFGVFPVLKVAPLWVSVFHLHASLSACNRDMPSIHSSVRTAERRHSQPHAEVLTDQSLHGDFHARLPHVFTRVISCLNINAIARYKNSAIHLPEDRNFLAQKDRKLGSFVLLIYNCFFVIYEFR